ncbi:putative exonuclease GOR isoform X2 [Leptopilina boulardi]|uniref:putative exonuclease GOR isoform X2 n=1 Tax=Leptopilina boulardi TaxID=63433 RepID=UPI0021F56E53|nr:putative exonuclease GOR isoform X2 [Leptopilina boulardi]
MKIMKMKIQKNEHSKQDCFPGIISYDSTTFGSSEVRTSMSNFSDSELEAKFQAYVVKKRELFARGFPEIDKDNLNYARVYVGKYGYIKKCYSQNPNFKLSETEVLRKCARCSSFFPMDSRTGDYLHGGEPCYVHPGKLLMGVWQCCGSDAYERQFCTIFPMHVWSGFTDGVNESLLGYVETIPLGDLAFEKTRYGVYALDCEMAFTKRGMEVIKISVVRMNGTAVYDHFVKPGDEIVDYGTEIHGITEEEILTATKTLGDVQNDLRKFIHAESLLIGHGVYNDLRILRFIHKRVIDTSLVFQHERGPQFCYSLKSLSKLILKKDIRAPGEFHDSVQDATLAMDIMLRKLQQDVDARRRKLNLNAS